MREPWLLCSVASQARVPDGGLRQGGGLGKRCGPGPMREPWLLCSVASQARVEAPDGGLRQGGGLGKRCGRGPTRQGCGSASQGCQTSATRVAGLSPWVFFISFLFILIA